MRRHCRLYHCRSRLASEPVPAVPPSIGEVFAADAESGAGACGGAPEAMVKTGGAGFSACGRIKGGKERTAVAR